MNIILLSGGSGKRLWPLSNDIRSKQFIKIFKNDDGYESIVQRVYRQITEVDKDADIIVATSKSQVSALYNQIGEHIDVCVEPCRRDTFPAIALSAAYMVDVKGMGLSEAVVICPVDPYVEAEYFSALRELQMIVEQGKCNLALMGIKPTYPSEKYGYIIPDSKEKVSMVTAFKEKPSYELAEEYIAQEALWNGGVFACRLSYLKDKTKELIGFHNYDEILKNYENLPHISFDYAVVEKEKNIRVQRFSGSWKDVGTWNTLTETMDENVIGLGEINRCENVHILNELDVPVLAIGMKNIVIGASPEGILVSDKYASSFMKPMVEKLSSEVMFADKSWGEYRVIDVSENSRTIKVTLRSGEHMNYHSHERRNEVWTVISGNGHAIIDGIEQQIKEGDVIAMQAGCRHTVIADTELELIEVQLGRDISVSDKRKFALDLSDYEEVT